MLEKLKNFAVTLALPVKLSCPAVFVCFSISAFVQAQEPFDFAHRLVPLIQKYCSECHVGSEKQGGYSLNTRESAVAGGDSEKAILPSNIEESELLRRLLSNNPEDQMPPEGERLSSEEVASFREWLAAGAPWEAGFTLGENEYVPPLLPRRPELPAPIAAQRNHPIDRILDAY